MKLGKRLKHIDSMVTATYDHIWDCCCDHGLLGAALLARQAAPKIHFVDIVPELMHELKNKLAHFYPENIEPTSSTQWQAHCMDVSALPLQKYTGKHLVIIAGVGGDLMTELVKTIYQKNTAVDIDFLLCPVHHQFTLRQQLIELNFSLKSECLIAENHRFYEILLVSTDRSNFHTPVNEVGSLIWKSDAPEQAKIASDYLKKTLDHYKRVQLNRKTEVQHIIDAYSRVTL
ncbi:MAG: tRNA (adenine(22)-N(1))-methyltransferase TrmK [Cellvibrio sp.]|uniref:tRNA (adenine(22)-N(1))-methyltransferase n=1 Tax=Cellvibrio sp. TaxID=1965322 RepID=UPI0031A70291